MTLDATRKGCAVLAYDVFGEPHPAVRVNVEANADAVQRRAGQVDVVPARRSLVYHAFLDSVDVVPGRRRWPGQPDALAAIREGETLVCDAGALIQSIGAGMAETAVVHVPAMQPRTTCQCGVPDKGVQAAHRPVVVDEVKQLLGQLYFLRRQCWRLAVGSGPCARARNIRRRRTWIVGRG